MTFTSLNDLSYVASDGIYTMRHWILYIDVCVYACSCLCAGQPIVLNEVMVKKHSEPEADPCQFQVSHIERVYHLRAPNESER